MKPCLHYLDEVLQSQTPRTRANDEGSPFWQKGDLSQPQASRGMVFSRRECRATRATQRARTICSMDCLSETCKPVLASLSHPVSTISDLRDWGIALALNQPGGAPGCCSSCLSMVSSIAGRSCKSPITSLIVCPERDRPLISRCARRRERDGLRQTPPHTGNTLCGSSLTRMSPTLMLPDRQAAPDSVREITRKRPLRICRERSDSDRE